MKSTQIRLRLDPWPGDYESALQIEEFDQAPGAEIDTTVETGVWAGIPAATNLAQPPRIAFVDGVRRIDARIVGETSSGQPVYGMFGSLAAGVVQVEDRRASITQVSVRRYLILGSNESADSETLTFGNTSATFESYSVADGAPNAPMLALQNLMRTEEASLAEQLESSGAEVFADGPLNYFSGLKHRTVGVIKRLYQPYIPGGQFALLSQLKPGERTPVFAIRDGKYDRFAWYLRLAQPRAMDYGVAGVVRLEVRTGIGVDHALELATLASACLPRFASDSTRDPRSPQNLAPIGALEQELRRRLGDAITIRRGIEKRLFEGLSA
jgi:hypothetical protein